jgi:hypothetical protein
LKLDAATGVISGTPTQAKTFFFNMTATNSVSSHETFFTISIQDEAGNDAGCCNAGIGTTAMFFGLPALLCLRKKK